MAAALAEAVADNVCRDQRYQQDIGPCCRQHRRGFGNAAVARCKVGKAGAMEGERPVAGDSGKGGVPAGGDCRCLECSRIGLVAERGVAAEQACRTEVGEGKCGKSGFETAPDGPRKGCNKGCAGGPSLAAERPALGQLWIGGQGQWGGFPVAVSGGGTASTVCMKIL
jgi:hypothetical protein